MLPMMLAHRLHPYAFLLRARIISRPATTALRMTDLDNETTPVMENVYLAWSEEDDRLLYDNRNLPPAKLASLLGRGLNGVQRRLTKLTDVDSAAYARLFITGKDSSRISDDEKERLMPVQEILRLIKWDPACNSDDFTVVQ